MTQLDLRTVAHMLGGVVAGDHVLFPGPDHSAQDRSGSFRLAPEKPEGFIVYSHSARTSHMELKAHVEEVLGTGHTFVAPPPGSVEEDRLKVQRALSIWHNGFDPRGTPVEAYLRTRGLSLPEDAMEAIRWVPYCPFGKRQKVPAMVCLVRHIRDDVPLGIHRTAITHEGEKAYYPMFGGSECRAAMGSISSGAIKFGKPTDTLGVGEGIETTLSLRTFSDIPVWSLLNSNGLSSFPVIDGIETLVVAEDNDPAGRKAVGSLFRRWDAAGRDVNPITPPEEGDDLNDYIMKGGVHG